MTTTALRQEAIPMLSLDNLIFTILCLLASVVWAFDCVLFIRELS